MASRFTDYVTRGRALRDWREKLTSSSRATGRFARSEAILGRPGSCGPRGRSPNAAPHSRVVGSCGQGTRAFPSSPWTAWRPTMRWSEAAASPSFRRSLAVHCAQGTVPWCRFITPGTTSSSPISRWEHARSTRRCNARTVTAAFRRPWPGADAGRTRRGVEGREMASSDPPRRPPRHDDPARASS